MGVMALVVIYHIYPHIPETLTGEFLAVWGDFFINGIHHLIHICFGSAFFGGVIPAVAVLGIAFGPGHRWVGQLS